MERIRYFGFCGMIDQLNFVFVIDFFKKSFLVTISNYFRIVKLNSIKFVSGLAGCWWLMPVILGGDSGGRDQEDPKSDPANSS
jgi:hypothetical protein